MMTSSRVSLLFFLTICLTCSAAVPRQARPEGVGGVLSGLAGARLANAQRALAKTAFSPTDPYLIADAGGHLLVADSPLLARPEEGDSKQHDSDAAKEDGNRRRRRAFPDHAPSEVLPTGLPIHHSRRGAENVIFLDFDGHEQNSETYWGAFSAKPYDLDGDAAAFSDYEQDEISLVWARVTEDYAPFDVDVTTEEPPEFNNTVMRALVTSSYQVGGEPMPYHLSGGVAYVGVFGEDILQKAQPALIYYDNLVRRSDFVAEATSHELGHCLSLSHDGQGGSAYYQGSRDVSDPTSWGPIMGTGYYNSLSQWSSGDYPDATNQEDDVAALTARLGLRPDEAGATPTTATDLAVTSDRTYGAVGVITHRADVDVWRFIVVGEASVTVVALPWYADRYTPGQNLDILMKLLADDGSVLATAQPTGDTSATLERTLPPGLYFVSVEGDGERGKYSDYGSMGQYSLSVDMAVPTTTTTDHQPTTTTTSAVAACLFARLCEDCDKKLILQCETGSVLRITKATYGRTSTTTCPHPTVSATTTTGCIVDVSSTARQKCNDQSSCELTSCNEDHGDPCPGTYKYFEVSYFCAAESSAEPISCSVQSTKETAASSTTATTTATLSPLPWRRCGNLQVMLLDGPDVSWVDGAEACSHVGGTLYQPGVQEQNDFCASLIQAEGERQAHAGISDAVREGSFLTLDGVNIGTLPDFNWGRNMPTTGSDNDDDCVIVNRNGKFRDQSCTSSFRRAMCGKAAESNRVDECPELVQSEAPPPTSTRSEPWYRCGDVQLYAPDAPGTWLDAHTACTALGAELFRPGVPKRDAAAGSYLEKLGVTKAHAGLYNAEDGDTYMTLNHMPVRLLSGVAWSALVGTAEGNCGVINNNGTFGFGSCNVSTLPGLCQMPADTTRHDECFAQIAAGQGQLISHSVRSEVIFGVIVGAGLVLLWGLVVVAVVRARRRQVVSPSTTSSSESTYITPPPEANLLSDHRSQVLRSSFATDDGSPASRTGRTLSV